MRLEPGDDLGQVVGASPEGTHFILGSGIHREQTIVPRHGDRFTGEPGAVLSGARPLPAAAWERRDGYFSIGGQEAEGYAHGEVLDGGERVRHPEDLFLDDRRLTHVGSLAELDEPTEWFFDYPDDRVWMLADPAAHEVELAVTEFAFVGPFVRDVVIENLTVERYANWAQRGAINGRDSIDWTIRFVDARQNHGPGISIGPGIRVEHSRLIHNGHIGITGAGSIDADDHPDGHAVDHPVAIIGNEIAHNRELPYDWAWEGGGAKFVLNTAGRFVNNWSHDNGGPGLWLDIDTRDARICANLLERNVVGIFYEISHGAEIVGNITRENLADPEQRIGAAIYVLSSSDVHIHHNLGTDQRRGVLAIQQERGEGRYGRYRLDGLRVEDNVFGATDWTGVEVRDGELTAGQDIVFERNTYLVAASSPSWYWDGEIDFAGWQALGLDVRGQADPAAPARLPAEVPQYRPVHYGPVDGPLPPVDADVAGCP